MDITNIENEWKDLKNNNRRQTDLNNILKDLDSVHESSTKASEMKDQVKGLVRSFLADDSVSSQNRKPKKSISNFISVLKFY
jgi:hypothetical protein